MQQKNIFVTGASGFVGKELVKELVKQQYPVNIFVRHSSNIDDLKDLPIKISYGNIINKEDLKQAIKGSYVVIHLAAVLKNTTYAEYYDVHVEGSRNLIEVCKEEGIKRVIVISTTSTLAQKRMPYGETKHIADLLFQASKLDVTTLKPDFIYGKNGLGFTNVFNLVKKIPFMVPVIGDGKYTKQPIYVSDVVKAIMRVLEDDKTIGKTYVVAGNVSSFNDIIETLKQIRGVTKRIVHIPARIFYLAAFVLRKNKNAPFTRDSLNALFQSSNFDITALQKELNIIPIDFKDGVKIFLA